MHRRVFSSMAGLYPVDANSTTILYENKKSKRYSYSAKCQKNGEVKTSPVQNHYSKEILVSSIGGTQAAVTQEMTDGRGWGERGST